jgi:hypothetical protein
MKYTKCGSGLPALRRNPAVNGTPQGNPASPPRIEGVNMRKVYYTRMRKFAIALPCVCLTLTFAVLPSQSAQQQPAPLKTASLESHEGMTISARPLTEPSQYKDKFPKKSPLAAGVLAVQVVFRNDSDLSVKVNLDRIRLTFVLEEDNRQEIQALTPDQLADAVLKPGAKDPTMSHKKLPIPIPTSSNPKTRGNKDWVELQKDAQDAGIPTSVLAPHSSVTGLLYFDLQGQFDLLSSSHLYVPDIAVMEKGTSLTYFEIDLSRSGVN